MKNILVFIIFCNILNAQKLDSINAAMSSSKSILILKTNSKKFIQPLLNYDFIANNAAVISVFDRASGLNAQYVVGKNQLESLNKTYIFGNDVMRADSFDPNGSGNLGVGVFIGSLNFVIDQIFPNSKNGSILLFKKVKQQ